MIYEKLYPFQKTAVDFAVPRNGAAIFCEQGTGKTWIAAGILEELANTHYPKLEALLVVPLANIETTWVRTLTAECPWLTICRTWETYKKTAAPKVLLVHYEMVSSIIRKIHKRSWSTVIYDESQRLKARGSKQSRAAARFKNADQKIILSGTPVEQAPQDLWAQFRFALPGVFGKRWESFAERWLKPTGYMGYKWKFRKEKLGAFLELIEPHIHRVTKSEVLDLPPITILRRTVDLLGDQARIYREVTDDMIADVGDRTVTCDLAVTQLIRQQQIAGGYVRLDCNEADYAAVRGTKRVAKGPMVRVGRAKLRAVARVLEREDPPIVVFCQYSCEVAAVRHLVMSRQFRGRQLTVAEISGEEKKTRTATVEKFQRGEIDVLVCQVKAGGVGLDLQNSCVGIFYSSTWSWIDFDQAIARLHRNGQTRPVRFYLIQAANTVDTDIWTALITKESVTHAVLDRRRNKMGKKDKSEGKTETKAEEKKKPTPPKIERPKYGVPELAEALGIKASSVRVQLRNNEIPKKGKLYGWDSKAEMQEVVDKLKKNKKVKAPKADADDGDDDEDGDDD